MEVLVVPWKETRVMDVKFEFALKAMDPHVSMKDLCAEYGISRPTGHKWRNRFIQEGLAGLTERSRRPRISPNQTSEDILCDLIRIKVMHNKWGPKKIHEIYVRSHPHEETPSLTTVKRVLDKAGLVHHRKKRRQTKGQRLQSRLTANKPNDIWTVDFKGWWYTPDGERCEPLTVRDDFSKYILSIKAMQKAVTEEVKSEFERLFSIYGLPRVIRSDNGPPFACVRGLLGLTRLSVWWLALGIELDRITPGRPCENGSHERMHGDIKRELQGQIQGGLKKHQAHFDVWKNEYNSVRPHEALKMQTPETVYSKSKRPFSPEIPEVIYPTGYLVRSINNRGAVTIDRRRVFISYALTGYSVGLRENKDESMTVWFDNLRLGEIDLRTYGFTPSVEGVKCFV